MLLGGPHIVEFDTTDEQKFHIKIEQCGFRMIAITSDRDTSAFDLYAILTRIERLLMLLEGVFIPLSELKLSESDTANEKQLTSFQNNLIKGRLSYFSSADFCNYKVDKLLEFDTILTAELYSKWEQLLVELDLVHQVYLYFLSNSKITVDVKCAFLIELAEPLIEVVKEHTKFFSSLTPGPRGASLKNCLDALITKYGADIFGSELASDYERFLFAMVNSRVRIMHIKREQKGVFFNGNESVLYMLKMNLLYRRIMFEVLGIDEAIYKNSLLKCVSRLDEWNGILKGFLSKLSL
ncbi:Uncharacterised protein [uncultured Butyricicoccus sp.]|nr:Uncharacterised protein [uncultured Butyricicoccus sp.]